MGVWPLLGRAQIMGGGPRSDLDLRRKPHLGLGQLVLQSELEDMGIDLNSAPDHVKQCLPDQEKQALGKHGWTKEECEKAYEFETEKDLQDAVEAWINSQPTCHCSRSRMDKKTTTRPGTPDFFCSIDGLALYIECKRPGGKLSDTQEREIAHIRSRKGRVVVAQDLQTVQREVRELQAQMRFVRETLYKSGWKMK